MTVAWLVIATACLALAAVHLHVWLRQRQARAHVAFAALAVGVATMGYVEVRMLHADTIAEFGRMLDAGAGVGVLRRRRRLRSLIPARGSRLARMGCDRTAHADTDRGLLFVAQRRYRYMDRMFVIAPAGAYVQQWLQSFREFPPRQKPGSFNSSA